MTDDEYRRLARTAFGPIIDDLGSGPSWQEITGRQQPISRQRGLAVLALSLLGTVVLVGVFSTLLGSDQVATEASAGTGLGPAPTTQHESAFDAAVAVETGEAWWRSLIEGDLETLTAMSHPSADFNPEGWADLAEALGGVAGTSVGDDVFGTAQRPQLCYRIEGNTGSSYGSLVFDTDGEEWLVGEIRPNVERCIPSGAPARWSIQHPPGWSAAGSQLMPNLAWRSFTLATYDLRPGGGECAHMPVNALRDLGADDTLISIFAAGANAISGASQWPETGFNDALFPAVDRTDAHECADRPELEIHWGNWTIDGQGLWALVAFGADVTDQQRQQTWSVLSSLEYNDDPESIDHGFCVVTRPPRPGLDPSNAMSPATRLSPDQPYPERPVDPDSAWFGTLDLWTELRADGSYEPRKSVWWSTHFEGGAVEERPEISVLYDRLDADAPTTIQSERGTNAYTSETGWFMIADIDPNEPGCWEVTARYRDTVLSYVFQVP